MQTEKFTTMVALATKLQNIFNTYSDAYGSEICQRIINAGLFLLRNNQDDPEDKIYFKAICPLMTYSKQCDYRGLYSNMKKLKDLMLPDYIRQKQINDNIAYQMSKHYR